MNNDIPRWIYFQSRVTFWIEATESGADFSPSAPSSDYGQTEVCPTLSAPMVSEQIAQQFRRR